MRDAPDRFEWGRVLTEARDQMPMDMGQLIAEQFIVDLHRMPLLGQEGGEPAGACDAAVAELLSDDEGTP